MIIFFTILVLAVFTVGFFFALAQMQQDQHIIQDQQQVINALHETILISNQLLYVKDERLKICQQRVINHQQMLKDCATRVYSN